jgi:hypothetical protein
VRSLSALQLAPGERTEGESIEMADHGPEIIALDKKRMDAMCQKDITALNAILADDLIYTHSTARLDTKQSLIGGMESGTTVYTSIEPSDVTAQDCGSAVVLTGSAQIHVIARGRPTSFGVRFTDVYANRDGKWQMVTWQSTKLPD